MLVKMTKEGQEALLQAGTESHAAYLNAGWAQTETVAEDAEVPPIGEPIPENATPTEGEAQAATQVEDTAPATRRTRG